MQFDREQLQAAHELGEAILRFIRATDRMPAVKRHRASEATATVVRNDGDRLVRAAEAAQILAVSRGMIYQLMNSGTLPSVKLGSARRIKLSAVRKLIESDGQS